MEHHQIRSGGQRHPLKGQRTRIEKQGGTHLRQAGSHRIHDPDAGADEFVFNPLGEASERHVLERQREGLPQGTHEADGQRGTGG